MTSRMLWVFDLDGTLVDTATTVVSILNEKRLELGLAMETASFFYPWLSLGGEHLIENALSVQRESVPEHLSDFREPYASKATPLTASMWVCRIS